MATISHNPFKIVGEQYVDGLNYIITNLPANPTFEQLNDTTIAYVGGLFSTDEEDPSIAPILKTTVDSILPNTINDYINKQILANLNLTPLQENLIIDIYDGLFANPISSLKDYFETVDESITEASLTTLDKSAIFLSASIAKSSYGYWKEVIENNNPAGWSTYLNSNLAVNYANLAFYVASAYVGALSGFSQAQTPNFGFANIINNAGRTIAAPVAIAGALGLNSGLVIFKWSKKP